MQQNMRSEGAITQTEVFNDKNSQYLSNKFNEYANDMGTQPRLCKKTSKDIEMREVNVK